jgi:hypothetical protein
VPWQSTKPAKLLSFQSVVVNAEVMFLKESSLARSNKKVSGMRLSDNSRLPREASCSLCCGTIAQQRT